jgi:Cu2+-exporting ATPase
LVYVRTVHPAGARARIGRDLDWDHAAAGIGKVQAVDRYKTGTLTQGKPALTDVMEAPGISEAEVLRYAASADSNSEHPLARAIVEGATARGIMLASVSSFEALPGRGIQARVENHDVLIGNTVLLAEHAIAPILSAEAARYAAEGKTPVYVVVDGTITGLIAVADQPRPNAVAAVDRLHKLGVQVAMLTGDDRRTAEAVARAIGIERVSAEVLPGDKATGAGTDVAIETADVVLMQSDPSAVADAVILARGVRTKIVENLFWAAIFNVLAIPIAGGALYPSFRVLLAPEVSALLMNGSTLTVTLNALMLNRIQLR